MFDRKGLRLMEFPPIYILSLEGAQRFGPLVEALAARGLSYEIFWGIDGRERLPDKHEPRVDRAGAEAFEHQTELGQFVGARHQPVDLGLVQIDDLGQQQHLPRHA